MTARSEIDSCRENSPGAAHVRRALTLVTGVVYPARRDADRAARVPRAANGSLIERRRPRRRLAPDRPAVHDPKYFWSRPSATSPQPYNAAASSGSNQGRPTRRSRWRSATASPRCARRIRATRADSGRSRDRVGQRARSRTSRRPRPSTKSRASRASAACAPMRCAAGREAHRRTHIRRARRAARERARAQSRAGRSAQVAVPQALECSAKWSSSIAPTRTSYSRDVRAEEARARRGKLRIFFGATAGVGKTYAMLASARTVKAAGVEVVIGYIEPHGRVETEQLMEGLEAIPTLAIEYRGIMRREFDLDAALARRPAILLVDELAHSNLVGGEPAPRHPKRWQDVEELLEAGINVWTTVNVQHLESLNDLVAQITGSAAAGDPAGPRVRRGRRGRADRPAARRSARAAQGRARFTCRTKSRSAVDRFFRLPNLIALRELALRRMTSRVEAAAREIARPRPDVARVARARAAARRGRAGRAGRAARARGQAHGRRALCRLDVVYVETPWLQRSVGEGAQSPDRSAAARGVARCRDRDARRADRGRDNRRVRA